MWSIEHPMRSTLVVVICSSIGAGFGVLAAWIAETTHLASRTNVLAGAAMGLVCAFIGFAIGVTVVGRLDRYRQ